MIQYLYFGFKQIAYNVRQSDTKLPISADSLGENFRANLGHAIVVVFVNGFGESHFDQGFIYFGSVDFFHCFDARFPGCEVNKRVIPDLFYSVELLVIYNSVYQSENMCTVVCIEIFCK